MRLIIQTVRALSMGWVTALLIALLAVVFERSVMGAPQEWPFEGTFILVAALASLAYATGAMLILCAGFFASLRKNWTTKVFVCLGALAPLLEFMIQNMPRLGDHLGRMPWGVTPAISGAVSAAMLLLVRARSH